MKGGGNLERLVSGRDTVITGMKNNSEDQVLEAIFMRQPRLRSQMKDDAHGYERRPSGDDPRKSYPELHRTAKRQIERRRPQVHRGEITKFAAGGSAMSFAPKGGKRGETAGDKDKQGQIGKGNAVGNDQPAADALKGVCRSHLI